MRQYSVEERGGQCKDRADRLCDILQVNEMKVYRTALLAIGKYYIHYQGVGPKD